MFALAGSAQASPQLEQILDGQGLPTTRVAPGGTFTLKGRELYAAPEGEPEPEGFPGLSATLGGKPLRVTAASSEELRFSLDPDHPERDKQPLVVRFRGESLRATLDVGPVAQGTDGDPEPASLLVITRFELQTSGAGALFRAAGEAPAFLDGLKVQLALRYGEDEVQLRSLPLAKGGFETSFGPFRERLPVGHYALELSFSLNGQSRLKVKSLERTIAASSSVAEAQTTLDRLKEVRQVAWLNVGGSGPGGQILPIDRAPQIEALRARVAALTAASEALLLRLEECYALAARVHLRRGGELPKDAYLAWLVAQGHAADQAGAERLYADTRFASRRGELDEAAWKALLEGELYPGLRAALQAEVAFAQETLCPLDRGAQRLALQALSELYALIRERSVGLFKAAGAVLPLELSSPELGANGGLAPAPRSSPKRLRATLRELGARVGAPG